MDRAALTNRLSAPHQLWDVVVIGGGSTGLGVALDAVSRGYATLLLEQSDFSKGTSSRSTKLVHGGVRYLAQGDLGLVREASVERGLLWQNAPHLVKNQTFIIPVYHFWDRVKYTIGLKLYDWIAGTLSLGSSLFLSKEKTIAALPGIQTKGLAGGILYHDGQFDDSRMAVNLAQTIMEQGGLAVNYVKATGLLKNKDQKIEGLSATDMETGASFTIRSRAVVNATGVFVDGILKMDNSAALKTVVPSQGIHLVLDRKCYPSEHALMIPQTSDGRVLFAVPWHDKVVVGTTDTPVAEASLEPQALEKEIKFVLDTAAGYLSQKPTRADVRSVFAGLRPLAAPKEGKQKTREISRSHRILVSDSGLFTMIGGKWTTFRKMGEDLVNSIEKYLQWKHRPTQTRSLRIHGFSTDSDRQDPFYFYGSDGAFIKQQISNGNGGWLSESLNIHETQLQWAIDHEMARTVEDFLARRTRALFLNARESIRMCPRVAQLMAARLNKDEDWAENEIIQYTKLARQYVLS